MRNGFSSGLEPGVGGLTTTRISFLLCVVFLMIVEYRQRSMLLGVPGVLLQVAADLAILLNHRLNAPGIWGIVFVVGSFLFFVSLSYFARSKGRSPGLCILGMFWVLGILLVASLPDRSG